MKIPSLALALMLSGPVFAAAADPAYKFISVAGVTYRGAADGPLKEATFYQPMDAEQAGDGTVYVADPFLLTIRRISPTGQVSVLAGSGKWGSKDGVGTEAMLANPRRLALGRDGTVYVADGNHVRKISAAGVVTTIAGKNEQWGYVDGPGNLARFDYAHGIALDGAGNLYIAELGNGTIRKITPDGMVSTVAGAARDLRHADGTLAAARFRRPATLAFSPSGDLYVGDATCVRKIANGTVTTYAGSETYADQNGFLTEARFRLINDICFDSAGNLVVVDLRKIKRISPTGVVTTLAGTGDFGRTDGAGATARFGDGFSGPEGLGSDGKGGVIVADSPNSTLRRIEANGTVSTWAGVQFTGPDGVGAAARFSVGGAMVADASGNLYMTDRYANAVRKITPSGEVTTIAGVYGESGSRDGAAAQARFLYPSAISLAPDGTPYVADSFNHTIRRIGRDGMVTTVAGASGVQGTVDGPGREARFNQPEGMIIAPDGALLIADTWNHTIRRMGTDGRVTTIAGTPGVQGAKDGPAATATLQAPAAMAFAPNGDLLIGELMGTKLRVLTPAGQVTTLTHGTLNDVRLETVTGLAVDRSGIIYLSSWGGIFAIMPEGRRVAIGAIPSDGSHSVGIALTATGELYVNGGGEVFRGEIVQPARARLANLSVRTNSTGLGAQPLIVGFVVAGDAAPKRALVRAIGPGLGAFGVTNAAADARLKVVDAANAITAENDDWAGASTIASAAAQVGAFPLVANSKDAAVVTAVAARPYTAQANASSGIVLVELYDLDPDTYQNRLVNVSALSQAGTGEAALIAGFAISGNASKTVLIRAVGPTLANFGLPAAEVLADPQLRVRDSSGRDVGQNLDWWNNLVDEVTPAGAAVGAFALPARSRDAAIVLTLAPGSYTVEVTGGAGALPGTALVEIYDVR